MSEIDFEQGQFGTKAIIKVQWHDSLLELLLKKDIRELELNIGKGWRGKSIEFLKELSHLQSLRILDNPLKLIQPIHYLHELVDLHLETYSDIPVDFSSFPYLTDCFFEWIKGSDSLFDCRGLNRLGINNYKKKSSEPLANLVNLEKLSLLNSDVENLDGIVKLINLTYLRLANLRSLTSLNGIQNLRNLTELEIQRCKGIHSVSDIFELAKLQRLLLLDVGGIESIRGIENLMELREFFFYESTNVLDGDLTPIRKLKNLSKISFQNRRHYTHRREDFGKMYA
jgi:Leucine-rich repeat (LRR) protein